MNQRVYWSISTMALIVLCALCASCQSTFVPLTNTIGETSRVQDPTVTPEEHSETPANAPLVPTRTTTLGSVPIPPLPTTTRPTPTVLRVASQEKVRLVGLVRDGAVGSPVVGAVIRYGPAQITTAEEGRFEVEALPRASLSISCTGYLPVEMSAKEVEVHLSAAAVLTQPLTILLTPRILVGTVTESDSGLPVSDALVSVGDVTTTSDTNGHYQIRYVEPGSEITFSSPDHRPHASVTYREQAKEDAVLEPWQATLTVTDWETSESLFGAWVIAGELFTQTDALGCASLRVLPDTTIEVSHEGYLSLTVIYQGQEVVVAALQPSRLTGSLRDKDTGDPIPHALIQLFPDEKSSPVLLRSDEDGRFALDDALGITELVVKAPGYRRTSATITRTRTLNILLEPFEVRGIYIPFGSLTVPSRIDALLEMVENSELNAVVVDVKSDRARLAWDSSVPLARELDTYQRDVMDLESFVTECHARDIYAIARMVVFKDTLLAVGRREWAVTREEGTLYADLEGLHWVDPFRQEVRDYNIALALEVAALGFDEIQFDYLRFPSDGGTKGLVYSQEASFEGRTAAMAQFCAQAYGALNTTPAFVSADVFGFTVWVDPSRDMGIGQRVDDIAPYVDYISPMLYPSTFGRGNLGYEEPALHPYDLVYRSVIKAKARTSTRVRPWLQHYSLGGVTYGPLELLKQKKGAEDAGSCGWLFWNAGGKYLAEIFQPNAYDALMVETPQAEGQGQAE